MTEFLTRCGAFVFAGTGLIAAQAEPPSATANDSVLEEVTVSALEPRYVAPTTRDRIGRIWAPVYINDKGPFRMVLDTGASGSGVIAKVAETLGIPLDESARMQLRGATGLATVPSIRVESMVMGDMLLRGKKLPIITDALGGAEGVLGSEGLTDKRVHIDFRHDQISIVRSHGERAELGFITVPMQLLHGRLLTVAASVGNVRVKAIIDTGGQVTIANLSLRDALKRQQLQEGPTDDVIIGTTLDEEHGEGYPTPPIHLGDIQIRSPHVTYSDLHIFKYWKLTDEPAVLIGMDVLGLLDTLIIDYKRRELQIKMRS
jgi:Aspartyl protease